MDGIITNRMRAHGASTWVASAVIALAMIVPSSPVVHAQDDDAKKILKSMSEYLTAQQVVSATFDTDIEVVTQHLQKIQFTSSGKLLMSRPDKLRVSRVGGYSDVELVLSGSTATIHGKHNNVYAQMNASGSIDQVVNRLRDEWHMVIPGADLLLARVYDQLMEDVVEAKYIGHGVIDDIECDHLAFRNVETDWQLWVERGSRPIPRKYVITSKTTTGAPQYTLRVKSWTTGAPVNPDAFAFKAPAGAKSVDLKELEDIDEVPSVATTGARQ
jgi:hypothetical protein